MNRYWLYPKVRNIKLIIPYVFLGILLSGTYGAVHDQLSYTLSPEYFTKFKFFQFYYADFGLPNRVFASIIGFTATWWVGMIAAWFLGKTRFDSDDLSTAKSDMLQGFLTVFCTGFMVAVFGVLIGYIRAFHFPLNEFLGWEKMLSGRELQNFTVVGYLHNSGYLGGLLGLIIAVINIKRKMKKLEDRP